MNTTRTHRMVIAAALTAALAGSLAACATVDRNDATVTTVAHGAGELASYLQIQDQIKVERARLHPQSAVEIIQRDIAKERERLQQQRAE